MTFTLNLNKNMFSLMTLIPDDETAKTFHFILNSASDYTSERVMTRLQKGLTGPVLIYFTDESPFLYKEFLVRTEPYLMPITGGPGTYHYQSHFYDPNNGIWVDSGDDCEIVVNDGTP
jgi:hypothetical protein